MLEDHPNLIDQMIGVLFFVLATLLFVTPFALILLSPLLGGM